MEPLTALQEGADPAMEEFVAAALELHTTKQQEHVQFVTALGEAKEKNGGESKAEIAKYKALKKRALNEGSGGEQPQAVVQVRPNPNPNPDPNPNSKPLTLTLTPECDSHP